MSGGDRPIPCSPVLLRIEFLKFGGQIPCRCTPVGERRLAGLGERDPRPMRTRRLFPVAAFGTMSCRTQHFAPAAETCGYNPFEPSPSKCWRPCFVSPAGRCAPGHRSVAPVSSWPCCILCSGSSSGCSERTIMEGPGRCRCLVEIRTCRNCLIGGWKWTESVIDGWRRTFAEFDFPAWLN